MFYLGRYNSTRGTSVCRFKHEEPKSQKEAILFLTISDSRKNAQRFAERQYSYIFLVLSLRLFLNYS